MLPAQRVRCKVELGVDVLEHGHLIFSPRLVQCNFPGYNLKFRGLRLTTCQRAEMLSAFTRTIEPMGNLVSHSLAAKRRQRDSQSAICFGRPGTAPVLNVNSNGMGQLKYSTAAPPMRRTPPKPQVDASVMTIAPEAGFTALTTRVNGTVVSSRRAKTQLWPEQSAWCARAFWPSTGHHPSPTPPR